MGEISRGEVRDFCHRMMAEGLSAASVKVTLIIISCLFNNAIEDGLVSENPAEKPGRYLRIPSRRGKVDFSPPGKAPPCSPPRRSISPGSIPS